MTDVDSDSDVPVEEPVEDKQSLQMPESLREDEDDEETDTDDGAVEDDEDIHGSSIITDSFPFHTWQVFECPNQSLIHVMLMPA